MAATTENRVESPAAEKGVSAADAFDMLMSEYVRRQQPPDEAGGFERTMLSVVRGWANEKIKAINVQTYHAANGSYLNRRYLANQYNLGAEVGMDIQPYPAAMNVFLPGDESRQAQPPAPPALRPGTGAGKLRRLWPLLAGGAIGAAGLGLGGAAASGLLGGGATPAVEQPDASLDLQVR